MSTANRVASAAAAHGPKREWIEPAARAGYAAKGGVYILLGVLAVMAAFGVAGGKTDGAKGAIQEMASQSFGQILVIIVGIGLAGYALWRFVQAGLDAENAGTEAKGLIKRFGYAASGLAHVSLTVYAFQLVSGGGGGGDKRRTWLAQALGESWGPYLVGALGVFVFGVGLHQLYKAFTLKFREELKTHEMSQRVEKSVTVIGRIGYTARGIIFPIMGYFLLSAAIDSDASDAKGVGGVLDVIAAEGSIPLAIISAGLVAYGFLQVALARYREIDAT